MCSIWIFLFERAIHIMSNQISKQIHDSSNIYMFEVLRKKIAYLLRFKVTLLLGNDFLDLKSFRNSDLRTLKFFRHPTSEILTWLNYEKFKYSDLLGLKIRFTTYAYMIQCFSLKWGNLVFDGLGAEKRGVLCVQ